MIRPRSFYFSADYEFGGIGVKGDWAGVGQLQIPRFARDDNPEK
jgi:hypothetical protein